MRVKFPILLLSACLSLAGCGDGQPGRLQGGTASGVAAGATFGLIGGPIGVVVGAAIGGAAGAITSTTTSPSQVDLGKPVWQRSGS
ncbi:MAG: hypothetical protein B7Z75_04960 [Acidocella sp. 20-57-95]|nr:MAG: hypothetical protein B7Z75_04960 [Acidocella sp. 20-57-95]OYV55929.1 MAG: hypothetical protein B7Z71_13000 [Acidocella sp. 21-58-7]HQT64360.1 hypothetical protein [Acidocella sp.]